MATDTGLFSEVYGCYFTVVAGILAQARDGMSKAQIESLIHSQAFGDSAFHLLPKLLSGEWSLLECRADGNYYSRLQSPETMRPMTGLEKSWLKALLSDKRIQLFADSDELAALERALADTQPLFSQEDFYVFDSAADGDPYGNEGYKRNFRLLLDACAARKPVRIDYVSAKQKRITKTVLPYKLNYSARDDKFRLQGVILHNGAAKSGIIINLARMCTVEPSQARCPAGIRPEAYFDNNTHTETVVLEIYKERGALERCMLQFASWQKQTEYDEERDCYVCRIYYDAADETELIIRVLSFGPVVRVLGGKHFLGQIKERIMRQYALIEGGGI